MDKTQLRVGQIGLGALGGRVAARLCAQGLPLHIYDVVDIAVRLFSNEVGGLITGSPKMMAQSCNVIIAVLPSTAELRNVIFGWEGLVKGFKPGSVLIDLGASDSVATVELAKELAGRGITLVDAPALGTPADARAGKLSFFVGGDEAAVERCRPLLAMLGERIIHTGAVGSAQVANALNDFLRAASLLAATESIRIGERFGLKPSALLEIGESMGALAPAMRRTLDDHVLTRRFESGQQLGLMLKDLDLALDLAKNAGFHSPVLTACSEAWTAALNEIGSGADTTAMVRWLERIMPPAPPEAVAPVPGTATADPARA